MNLISIAVAGIMSIFPVETQAQDHPSVECLTLNMYHEARNQGTAGLFAVSAVVLNRVNDSRFPNSICEVIKQGPTRESWKTRQHKNLPAEKRKYYPVRHKCQFSWWCDGIKDVIRDKMRYNDCITIAKHILSYRRKDITKGATHYHAKYVRPWWAKKLTKTVEIGTHIFYKM